MLLPKRQGKEWISGRNCWQLHGRTHRPLEVMAQDRTGHWRVERCPEATSHESSQVWLQVWRFFFCNGSWEHNSRVFSTGCFFNCYNTLASSILTHYILYLPLRLFSRHLQFLQDLRAQEFTRLGTGTQIGETSGNESCEYRQPRRGRTRKTTSVGSTSQGNELVVLWKYVKVTVFFKT